MCTGSDQERYTEGDMDIENMTPEQLFNADIFELLHLQDLPEEQKQRQLAEMEEALQGEIFANVVSRLPDDVLPDFEAVVEERNPEKLRAFLTGRGIDLQAIVVEETLKYRYELVRTVEARLSEEQPASASHHA